MSAKNYLTIVLALVSVGWAYAQTNTKIDLRLWNRLHEEQVSKQNISLLVKGDLNKVKALTERVGGIYKYGYANISSLEIPAKNVIAFSENSTIEKIENTNGRGVALMDTARIRNNIDSVHAGYSPLPGNLKGRNVVVGIIDGGIYFQHEDFKKPNGDTRIRYIWDQVASGGNVPVPYSYGSQWNWMDINNGNCSHIPPANDYGHGTCVAGIASGDGSSVSANPNLADKYVGVAPESEIIAVRINNEGNFLAHVADAVDYIFKKADALGRPCVINTSIGTYYGSHDGIDLATQIIEDLLDQRNGRVLVAAAGNAGNVPFHLSYPISADSAYTFFQYNSPTKEVYFDWWTDTANFNNALFAIGCNDNFGTSLRRTEYFSVPVDFNPPNGSNTVINRLLPNNTKFDTISISASLDEGRYHVEVLIHPSDITDYWRLQTMGSGKFDLWSSADVIGSADILQRGYSNYKNPDTLKTMVSSWQNSDKVITVGNYSNRAGYFDYDSNYVDLTAPGYDEVVGSKVVESSVGPTRDNRMKPDVMATGNTTLSTGDGNDIALKLGNGLAYKVALGGKHLRNGGTSMASPIVAGIAALYLEKRPTADYEEIKQAIICTAKRDNFTGNSPNNAYGYGKVNAFRALTASASCFVFGAKDTACINYNPLANADTGGCVAKVYGCMDSSAANYNSLANVEDGSCVVSSIRNISGEGISVQVVPNPFTEQTLFRVKGVNFKTGSIKIFNLLGEMVDEINLSDGRTEYVYRNASLSKGIYSYMLRADEKDFAVGKLVVE